MERHDQPSWTRPAVKLAEPHDLVMAGRGIIAARRVLYGKMPQGFPRDPALTILLHLFVMRESGEMPAVADLAFESDTAPGAAMRWCKALEQNGLIRLGTTVDLTEAGMDLVADMLIGVIESHAKLFGMPPVK